MEAKILTINEVEYTVGELNAIKQFHITRRLAPLVPHMFKAFQAGAQAARAASGEESEDNVSVAGVMDAVGPFAEALAHMSDEDSEYVIRTALGACRRRQGNTWVAITAPDGGIMFNDIQLSAILTLTFEVSKGIVMEVFRSMPLTSKAVKG